MSIDHPPGIDCRNCHGVTMGHEFDELAIEGCWFPIFNFIRMFDWNRTSATCKPFSKSLRTMSLGKSHGWTPPEFPGWWQGRRGIATLELGRFSIPTVDDSEKKVGFQLVGSPQPLDGVFHGEIWSRNGWWSVGYPWGNPPMDNHPAIGRPFMETPEMNRGSGNKHHLQVP